MTGIGSKTPDSIFKEDTALFAIFNDFKNHRNLNLLLDQLVQFGTKDSEGESQESNGVNGKWDLRS